MNKSVYLLAKHAYDTIADYQHQYMEFIGYGSYSSIAQAHADRIAFGVWLKALRLVSPYADKVLFGEGAWESTQFFTNSKAVNHLDAVNRKLKKIMNHCK